MIIAASFGERRRIDRSTVEGEELDSTSEHGGKARARRDEIFRAPPRSRKGARRPLHGAGVRSELCLHDLRDGPGARRHDVVLNQSGEDHGRRRDPPT
jgi:hypothetical protein